MNKAFVKESDQDEDEELAASVPGLPTRARLARKVEWLSERVQDLMRELSTSSQTAFLVVTHDMNLARQMDRVLHLQEGCLTPI